MSRDWLIYWLIDWLIDWLIYWLIDWLIDLLIDWLIDRLTNWFIDWSVVCAGCWRGLLPLDGGEPGDPPDLRQQAHICTQGDQ